MEHNFSEPVGLETNRSNKFVHGDTVPAVDCRKDIYHIVRSNFHRLFRVPVGRPKRRSGFMAIGLLERST